MNDYQQQTIDNLTAAIQDLSTMLEWAKDQAIRPTMDDDQIVYFATRAKDIATFTQIYEAQTRHALNIID